MRTQTNTKKHIFIYFYFILFSCWWNMVTQSKRWYVRLFFLHMQMSIGPLWHAYRNYVRTALILKSYFFVTLHSSSDKSELNQCANDMHSLNIFARTSNMSRLLEVSFVEPKNGKQSSHAFYSRLDSHFKWNESNRLESMYTRTHYCSLGLNSFKLFRQYAQRTSICGDIDVIYWTKKEFKYFSNKLFIHLKKRKKHQTPHPWKHLVYWMILLRFVYSISVLLRQPPFDDWNNMAVSGFDFHIGCFPFVLSKLAHNHKTFVCI